MYSQNRDNGRVYALIRVDCVLQDKYRYSSAGCGCRFTARRRLSQRAQTSCIQEALKHNQLKQAKHICTDFSKFYLQTKCVCFKDFSCWFSRLSYLLATKRQFLKHFAGTKQHFFLQYSKQLKYSFKIRWTILKSVSTYSMTTKIYPNSKKLWIIH